MREEEGEKESIQAFFPRSSEFSRSEFIEPRTKVHFLNEGYPHVPKMRDFTKDPNEEIWGNKRFLAYEVFLRFPTFSTTVKPEKNSIFLKMVKRQFQLKTENSLDLE